MSVVVRMKAPKNCWGCPCGQSSWIWGDDGKEKMACFCGVDGNSEVDGHYILETDVEPKRPAWCPIICQLPAGHGQLIDADELFHNMFVTKDGKVVPNMDCDGRHHLSMHVEDVKRYICEAPTIVPAEAERSETK